jgi:hypothetical protein
MTDLAAVALNCARQLGRASADGLSIIANEADIKREIGETVRFYNRQPNALTEYKDMTLTTVADTTWYSALDMTTGSGDQDSSSRSTLDVNDIIRIRYIEGPPVFNYRIDYREFADFQDWLQGTGSSGYPTNYTMYAGQIGLYPTPNDAYSITVAADVKPVVPTEDSDESVWFDRAKEMIEAGACARVCLKYLRDTERARDFAVIEEAARSQFHSEEVRKKSSGRLKAHC